MIQNDQLYAPLELAIEITGFCNLSCLYCFNGNDNQCKKDIPFETIKEIIDEANDLDIFDICISGGEPFIRKDIFSIIDYIIKNNLNFSIVTNGTLLGRREVKLLDDRNIINNLQISIDSHLPEIQNIVRGSYNDTVNAINQIDDLSESKPSLGCVIHKQNYMNFIDTLKFFSPKCENFHLMNVQASSRAIHNKELLFIDAISLSKFWEEIESFTSKESIEVDIYKNDLVPIETARFTGCTAGKTKLIIKPDLKIIPCDITRDIILGDFRSNSLIEIWNADKRKDIARRDIEPCLDNNLLWYTT